MKNNNILKKDIFVFILFLLIFYSIFRYSESIDKGFKIGEDHVLILINQSIEPVSFSGVYKQMLKTDIKLTKRFRPMWVFYTCAIVKLFKVNLVLLNIFVLFVCICTAFLLYKFCLNSAFTVTQSFLFALLTMIGPATIAWSRIFDSEIIGMLMLSLSLFFLSKSIYSKKHQLIYKSCFILSLFLTALSKESFLITVPAVLFIYIWFYSSKNNLGFIQSLKDNYAILLFTSVSSLGIILCIFKFIGINPTGSYTGVNVNSFSSLTIRDFIYTVFKTNIFLVILFGIFILFENSVLNSNFKSKYIRNKNKTVLFIFIFMLLFVVPQLILYYKTGLMQRYYLPYLLGFSFTVIFILKIIFDSKSIPPFIKYLYLSTVIGFLAIELTTTTLPSISLFAKSCKFNTDVLQTIAQNQSKELLIVMEPVQNFYEIYPIPILLQYLNGEKELKFDFIKADFLNNTYADTSVYNTAAKLCKKEYGIKQIDSTKDNSGIGSILIFWGLNKKFLEKNKSWFHESDYKMKQQGVFSLYFK